MITCYVCLNNNINTNKFCIKCGSKLDSEDKQLKSETDSSNSSENLSPGTRVGNYIIDNFLGIGGIGAVYLAHHQLLKQRVAIKMHDFFPSNPYLSEAFLRASNYLSQLHHTNIVRLHDYGFHNGKAYQAMEYIDGTTLGDAIPSWQTKNWIELCLTYLLPLLSALRYAHNCQYLDINGESKRGIIHGDIRPHNVFIIRNEGTIKLTDFMIPNPRMFLNQELPDFKYLEDAFRTTSLGTPGYFAPEQASGVVTPRSDIFSLGATIHTALTGYNPYEVYDSYDNVFLSPRQINPDVPTWLDKLIMKALEKNPSKRFQTIAEMESIFLENTGQEKAFFDIKVKEWIMGDRVENKIGDISNISGQLFIGKFNDVVANLNATGQNELAEALKVLKESVMASHNLPEDKKQEQVEVINQIGEEAAKPKPNKTILKLLGDGLIDTLKAIPDVAKAATAVAPILSGLL